MPRQNITGRDKTLYQQMVQDAMPKKKMLPQLAKAFVVGGLICCIGQGISDLGKNILHLNEEELSAFTAIVMVSELNPTEEGILLAPVQVLFKPAVNAQLTEKEYTMVLSVAKKNPDLPVTPVDPVDPDGSEIGHIEPNFNPEIG